MIKIQRPNCPHQSALENQDHKHPKNKKALSEASYGKCMYCESKVEAIDYGDVEHIKPKNKFPDLEHQWSNLGFSCRKCNRTKWNKFDPEAPYVNPYEEDPKEFLIPFGEALSAIKGNIRGRVTIEEIELNRDDLLEKRMTKIKALEAIFNEFSVQKNRTLAQKALEAIKEHYDDSHEYSFFLKDLLQRHGF